MVKIIIVVKIWKSLQDKLKDKEYNKLEKFNYDLKANKIKSLPTILISETQIYDPNSETDIINRATISN